MWRERIGKHVAEQALQKCFCGAIVIRRIMRLQRLGSIGMRCCSPVRWRNAGAEEEVVVQEEEEEDEDRQSGAYFLGGGVWGGKGGLHFSSKGKNDGKHECECKTDLFLRKPNSRRRRFTIE